ncbi:MAG: hypothetical protein AB1649_01595 [Chloroflexota bacterium]
MKTKSERFILGLTLAPLAPLTSLLGGWWLSYALLPEDLIWIGALSGLLLGILADFLFLKKLLDRAHQLSILFWAAVFLFYSIGIFGFFMGVPVFNVGLAILAGIVYGARLAARRASLAQVLTMTRRTAGFTTAVLALICIASAIIASADPYTAANLEGMFNLSFTVTEAMVIGLIIVGGIGLLVMNWWLADTVTRFSYMFFQRA